MDSDEVNESKDGERDCGIETVLLFSMTHSRLIKGIYSFIRAMDLMC